MPGLFCGVDFLVERGELADGCGISTRMQSPPVFNQELLPNIASDSTERGAAAIRGAYPYCAELAPRLAARNVARSFRRARFVQSATGATTENLARW